MFDNGRNIARSLEHFKPDASKYRATQTTGCGEIPDKFDYHGIEFMPASQDSKQHYMWHSIYAQLLRKRRYARS